MIVNRLISEILFGFTGLIGIINPIGIAFLFLERTEALTEQERDLLARKVAFNAFVVLMVAFFAGTPVLHFFGISMEALRIGGGFAVAVAGWQMLNEPDGPGGGDTPVKPIDANAIMTRAFFPLTMPLTVGPGSIATAIALNANRTHKLSEFALSSIVSIAVSVLVAIVIWQVYSRSALLSRYLGSEGTKVAKRVSAFLLLCIGVQIMLTGFSAFLQPIADWPSKRPAPLLRGRRPYDLALTTTFVRCGDAARILPPGIPCDGPADARRASGRQLNFNGARNGIREIRIDGAGGVEAGAGLHDVRRTVTRHASVDAAGSAEPSDHPAGGRSRHQLLRYREHVFRRHVGGDRRPRAARFRETRRHRDRDQGVLPDAARAERRGLSRKAIMTDIDQSLKRLGTDYVDLYQIHRWDDGTPLEETLEALHDVVKAGKARYIGASSMFAWQFAKALHTSKQHGWTRFVSMQNHLNLLYREEEREMLPLCEDEGIAVIPWSRARPPHAQLGRVDRAAAERRGRPAALRCDGGVGQGGRRCRGGDRGRPQRAACAGRACLSRKSAGHRADCRHFEAAAAGRRTGRARTETDRRRDRDARTPVRAARGRRDQLSGAARPSARGVEHRVGEQAEVNDVQPACASADASSPPRRQARP